MATYTCPVCGKAIADDAMSSCPGCSWNLSQDIQYAPLLGEPGEALKAAYAERLNLAQSAWEGRKAIEDLQSRMREILRMLQERETEWQEAQRRQEQGIAELKKTLEGLQLKSQELSAELEGQEAKGSEIETKLLRIEARDKEVKSAIKGREARDKEVQSAIGGLESRNKELQSAIEGLEARDTDVQSRIGGLEAREKEVQSAIEGLEARDKEMQSAIGGVDARDKEVRSRIEGLDARDKDVQSRIGGLESRGKDAQSRIGKLESRDKELRSAIEGWEAGDKDVRSTIAILKAEGQKTTTRLERAEDRARRFQWWVIGGGAGAVVSLVAMIFVVGALGRGKVEDITDRTANTPVPVSTQGAQEPRKVADAAQTKPSLLEMVRVEGGSFQMGSESGADDEKPVHKVTVSTFLMSKYEVTQGQYRKVTGKNPSYFTSGSDAERRPVEQVSWYDAVEFCNKLSEKEGLQRVYTIMGRTPSTGYPITSAGVTMDMTKNGYRLPTEAEWEYAARGGRQSKGYEYAGSNDVGSVAWYSSNSGNTTHAVGTKGANELGLYDMSGNVWEWCWDWYGNYPSGAQSDPTGASSGTYRVKRGGSWYDSAEFCRSAARGSGYPADRYSTFGFRLVRRP